MTTDLAPSEDNLSRGGALPLCNCFDFWTRDEERDVKEVVAECRVRCDMDVLLFSVIDEFLAG